MDFILAIVFLILSLFYILKMFSDRNLISFQVGVLSAFSIGYFCLPVIFKFRSNLNNINSFLIFESLLIFFLFFCFILLGVFFGKKIFEKKINGIQLLVLDSMFIKHRKLIVCFSTILLLYYYSTTNLTSYSSDDFEAFFHEDRGAFSALLAMFSKIALGFITLSLAMAIKSKEKKNVFLFTFCFILSILPLFLLGQRLIILTPFIFIAVSFAVFNLWDFSKKFFITAILLLVLVSPFAVFVRESMTNPNITISEVISNFDYGDRVVDEVFQSILDRGDLLFVTTKIKPVLDAEPFMGPTYYSSVIFNFIPKSLYPGGEKPYPLSPSGLANDELSIKAWREIHSQSTGSLTAFGGLFAYREIGWFGVILNGFMTGIFFVLIYYLLGRSSIVLGPFYLLFFVETVVKKVPASFWESVLVLIPQLPIIFLLILINSLVLPFFKKGHKVE
jgi:hypothetical protein